MIQLPAIHDKTKPHQAPYVKKGQHAIPDEQHADFWQAIYDILVQSNIFAPPVRNTHKKINPYFGYFGPRAEPGEGHKQAFHTGIDVESRRRTNVYAMAEGVLQYSGYGVVNGKYVMLSHPQIATEDGFVLHTLYMHLDSYELQFSSYQKMLREISLHTYPVISVKQGDVIGGVGKTGYSDYPDEYTHVHIQAEFIDKQGRIVHIDPAQLLGLGTPANSTAGIEKGKPFIDLYLKNRKDIFKRKLQGVWADVLEGKGKKIDTSA